MTSFDLHRQQVNLTMVSAHYALKQLYDAFGPDLLKQTINSFEARDEAQKSTPINPSLAYSKGNSEFVLR